MIENEDGLTPSRVIVFGASGTIGRACVRQLVEDGHDVIAVFRDSASCASTCQFEVRICNVTDPGSISQNVFGTNAVDVVISCLASRSGVESDAWLVDYQANLNILNTARSAGVRHMILLSAICVQKPLLAFQKAKLAFENELVNSGLSYSIIRPTAFFKSLSGQVERVKKGKPFLVFGDGNLTRCKPISDSDLARYVSGCITDSARHDQILRIGGPGPAISPREQGEKLFELVGRKPRFRRIPIAFLDLAIGFLRQIGRLSRRMDEMAEYGRIARYYATESMLVFDPENNRYSAAATPETGSQTLFEHYEQMLKGKE